MDIKSILLTGEECKIFNSTHKTKPGLKYIVFRKGTFYATDGNMLVCLEKIKGYDGPDLYFQKPTVMPNKNGFMLIEIDDGIVSCKVNKTGKDGEYLIPVDSHISSVGSVFPNVQSVFDSLYKSQKGHRFGVNLSLLAKIIDVIGKNVVIETGSELDPIQVWKQGEPKPHHPSLIMPMRIE